MFLASGSGQLDAPMMVGHVRAHCDDALDVSRADSHGKQYVLGRLSQVRGAYACNKVCDLSRQPRQAVRAGQAVTCEGKGVHVCMMGRR